MSELIQVEEYADLKRDTKSGAIINTNITQLQKARARKAAAITQTGDIEYLKKEMSDLKFMMNEILIQLKEK